MKWIPVVVMCLALGSCSTPSDPDLSQAVAAGDIGRVEELIDQGADLESPSSLGMTPLMRAANRDYAEMVSLLIEGGAEVDGTGSDGLTALHVAARADAFHAGRMLLEAGADPLERSPSGMRAVDHAAAAGATAFLELLVVEWDVEPDEPSAAVTQGHGYPRDLGPTPLGLAVREDHLESVETLLGLGASVDGPSASGHTPLLLAVFFDASPEVVMALIDAGADPQMTARCDAGCSVGGGRPLTALEWAIELDREELVPLLDL